MSPINVINRSLKTQILLFIGILITLLMIGISFSILFEWRSLIIESRTQSARDVTRAFSISILDALIYSENASFHLEEQLETQIADFKQKVPDIKYLAILDNERNVIGHTDLTKYTNIYNDPKTIEICSTDSLINSIYNNQEYGWIIETVFPLQISGKRWGILKIGIDAEPLRSEIRNLFFRLFFSTIFVIGITLIVLYLLIERITGSLKELTKIMDKIDIDSDELDNQPKRNDEIGFLVQHFNVLQKRLAQQREQLLSAQKQIYHAEKLASIGRLASGVAHEINNPLNGIKSCMYSISKDPRDIAQNESYLGLINEGLSHIEIIVQKLLGFAHQQSKVVGSVNVNSGIEKVLQLLDYKLSQKKIEITHKLDKELPTIYADEQLIQEVIMNLLLNSMDAITEEGKIVIETGIQSQGQIYISIEDNGSGISDKDLEKIFDPFYTTKEIGEGTGLGLSVSIGIVETHGGSIQVKSKVDTLPAGKAGGTTFKIILPIKEL